jgi:hypothetical protein
MHTHTAHADAMHDAAERYDRFAMSPLMCDPFRANVTLAFTERVVIAGDADCELDALMADVTIAGPRGAAQFARLYAAHVAGLAEITPILSIRLDRATAAARQMRGILRWLLACNGYGEDVLQDVIVEALEYADTVTVGTVIALAPQVLMHREGDAALEREARDSTPIEWLD